jgi:hypothetical protein
MYIVLNHSKPVDVFLEQQIGMSTEELRIALWLIMHCLTAKATQAAILERFSQTCIGPSPRRLSSSSGRQSLGTHSQSDDWPIMHEDNQIVSLASNVPSL